MSFRINTYQYNFQGNPGNWGDARFTYQWACDNAIILSEPVITVTVGTEKIVPMEEIKTERYYEINQNKAYFNNCPPTTEMDKDDPHQDMTRIFNPIPKQLVKKGALFLFGQQKFKGIDSFKIKGNVELEKQWQQVWAYNHMDMQLIDQGQSYLRDGDVFYKALSRKTGLMEKVAADALSQDPEQMQQREVAMVKFLKTDAAHWSAIVSIENPDLIVAWIYQFEKADGTYTREEYFRDRTIYYKGERVQADAAKKPSYLPGLVPATISIQEKIKFVVTDIEEHNLGMFPIVRVKNNEQSTFWGPSIYLGHYGQFDRLNEVYTQLGYAIKMMSDPLLWVAGAEVADQNTKAADAVWSFTNPQASLNILQWPGIPDSVFRFIEMVESKIYDDAFVPRTSDLSMIFQNENRMSGQGLKELKSDTVDATLARRNDFEYGFKQMLELVALLSDIKIPQDGISVDIIWGPVFQTGATDKRDSLLKYYDDKIITRETVIELSDDFPSEMKPELIADLNKVDQETADQAMIVAKAEAAANPQPAAPSTSTRKRTPKPKA